MANAVAKIAVIAGDGIGQEVVPAHQHHGALQPPMANFSLLPLTFPFPNAGANF